LFGTAFAFRTIAEVRRSTEAASEDFGTAEVHDSFSLKEA